ncbi:MAG: hypothetical protein ABIJ43_01995 [Candidatus Beckwithbacteria bacterium]|nr:hypothetical protein [Patescibacteria group bacterium]
MKINVSKIVGAANSKTWSQVHEFLPKETNNQGSELASTDVKDRPASAGLEVRNPTDLNKSHGHLMAALSFEAKKEKIEVSSFGTEIIKRLQELYYSNESDGVLKKMSQAMESLGAEFFNEVELEMVLMVILEVCQETVLYAGRSGGGPSASLGTGQVFLRRDGQLVKLIDGEINNLGVVSGKLKPGDSLVAGTTQFFEIVAEGLINSALEQESVELAVESLAPVVHGHEKNSRVAAVVGRCETFNKVTPSGFAVPTRHSAGSPVKESPLSRTDLTKKPYKIVDKVGEIVKNLWGKFQSKAVRVRSRDPKKQKSAATIALVLVLVFGLSLVMAGKKRQKTKQEEQLRQVFEEANYKYDEAQGLIELNPLRAKSLLKDSLEAIKFFESESKEALGEDLLSLVSKIEEALGDVSREYELESASEWFDFNLVKEGFKASDFEAEDDKLLVWDKDSKAVVEINLASKASKIVVGGDKVGGGSLTGLAGERGFIVSGDNITVINVNETEVVAEVAGDEWGDIKDAVGFSSNLYLLDGTSDGQIIKYMGVSSGLSSRRNYLTGDSYDFSEAVSMAIDGSVWVLFKDGTIVKYTRGVKDAFVVAGLDKGFEEPIKIFTSPEVENLYVLDRRSMRVVVIAKSGEYHAQYNWPGIAGVADLVASEELSKVFLLTTEKIFTIELK